MKIKYSEFELAEVVVDWIESKTWEVYQEVQFRTLASVADIVAIKDDQMWIVETKISLGLQVMAQADKWRCHYRSVAVLRGKKNRDYGRNLAYKICRNYLGIGVIEVHPSTHDIWTIVSPKLQEGVESFVEQQRRVLSPLHKNFAKAGSKGSGHLTNYKYTMLKVKEFIGDNPGCTLSEIIETVGKAHYMTEASAKQGIRKALTEWENWATTSWQGRQHVFHLKEEAHD